MKKIPLFELTKDLAVGIPFVDSNHQALVSLLNLVEACIDARDETFVLGPIVLYPAVDFLDLRRSGSSSQIINQAQDFPKQFPWHRHLGQLEGDIAAMADHLRADLHQFLPQRG
jgi:hypothetical protein